MSENDMDRKHAILEARKMRLQQTGGISPKIALEKKEAFLKTYPELTETYAKAEEHMNPNCSGCEKSKRGRIVLKALLAMEYDGRDLSALAEFLPDESINWLKKGQVEPPKQEPEPKKEESVPESSPEPAPKPIQEKKTEDNYSSESNHSSEPKPEEPQEEVVRDGCMDCVKKHLSQAIILMQEVLQGYSGDENMHKWLVVGHLSEAADEALEEDPKLANEIRKLRLKIMGQYNGQNQDQSE